MTSATHVDIVSTVHWAGDPRLNRHLTYGRAAGHEASLTTFRGRPRVLALVRSLIYIARSGAEVVILPDPELFFLGSITARIRGAHPVIDIHEDYPRAAMARSWVPEWARPIVRVMAAAAVWLGRAVAWRVMVAAPGLARSDDTVVLNVPDPSTLPPQPHDGSHRLVYIGDVTVARGALSMVETLGHLADDFRLEMIGQMSPSVRGQVESLARRLGVEARLEMTGQLDHADAWQRAQGALAGLNLLAPAPAYVEAVATKLWEYMAIGLPVIVSDLPGQRRVVSKIAPSLVCRTPAEVAALSELLAEDAGLRTALGLEARRLVEEKWEASRPDLALQSLLEP